MSQRQEHLTQAQHNERLANDLNYLTGFPDWVITIAFYASVHYVEAMITTKPERHSETSRPSEKSYHGWRADLLRKYHRKIWIEYRTLYEESRNARYLINQKSVRFGPPYYSDSYAAQLLSKDFLALKSDLGF